MPPVTHKSAACGVMLLLIAIGTAAVVNGGKCSFPGLNGAGNTFVASEWSVEHACSV